MVDEREYRRKASENQPVVITVTAFVDCLVCIDWIQRDGSRVSEEVVEHGATARLLADVEGILEVMVATRAHPIAVQRLRDRVKKALGAASGHT